MVKFSREKGWIHEEKGMAFIMFCSSCEWMGEQPNQVMNYQNNICPRCKTHESLSDHHIATPMYSTKVVEKGGE
jgi:uncharacterized paraquat-inducible protein A